MRAALFAVLATGYAVAALVVWASGWSALRESGRPVAAVDFPVVGGVAAMSFLAAIVLAAQPWLERRGLAEMASARTIMLAALALLLGLGSWLLVVSIPTSWPVPAVLTLVGVSWGVWREAKRPK